MFSVNRKLRGVAGGSSRAIINQGEITIAHCSSGIKIYWGGVEVTQGAGLNLGINTLGLWSDSSRADWRIIKKDKDYFEFKLTFWDLPLIQIWALKIVNNQEINWYVDMDVEELLQCDEFRALCLLNPRYKVWVNNYCQGNFPRLDNNWRDICLDNIATSLVGVRFPVEGNFSPAFIMEPNIKRKNNVYPLIQSASVNDAMQIVGLRKMPPQDKKDFWPGHHYLFSIKISLFADDCSLDDKI